MIASIMVGGSIYGYIQATKRGEFTAYTYAAHSQALQGLERMRAARWEVQGVATNIDELISANFPTVTNLLDMPVTGTNAVYVTIFHTISDVTTNPPLRLIRADAVWSFLGRGPFTNSIVSYRSAD